MRSFTRKDFIQLLIAAAIGYGVSQWLLRVAPVGTDVGANAIAQEIARDTQSPSLKVTDPTLTLVVFTDYQCPACKRANPEMDMAVAQDRHVRVVYRDWPIFGAMSERAAHVAIAVDRQGIYLAVHRRLMDETRPIDDTVLREVVEASGGNWDTLLKDLETHGAAIDAQIAQTKADAFSLGLRGTPAYLAGTRMVMGALDQASFTKLFAQGRDR